MRANQLFTKKQRGTPVLHGIRSKIRLGGEPEWSILFKELYSPQIYVGSASDNPQIELVSDIYSKKGVMSNDDNMLINELLNNFQTIDTRIGSFKNSTLCKNTLNAPRFTSQAAIDEESGMKVNTHEFGSDDMRERPDVALGDITI